MCMGRCMYVCLSMVVIALYLRENVDEERASGGSTKLVPWSVFWSDRVDSIRVEPDSPPLFYHKPMGRKGEQHDAKASRRDRFCLENKTTSALQYNDFCQMAVVSSCA
mmetsp:Transcript_20906/g.32340  ORF Transcript_20906/g.32340 Transcript_20906/m.32340 type:complete len:108 (-) Transcript_20906:420-743(-)